MSDAPTATPMAVCQVAASNREMASTRVHVDRAEPRQPILAHACDVLRRPEMDAAASGVTTQALLPFAGDRIHATRVRAVERLWRKKNQGVESARRWARLSWL